MTKHLTRRTFTIAAGAALFAPAIGGAPARPTRRIACAFRSTPRRRI